MQAKVQKGPKNTYTITVTHSPDEIAKSKDAVIKKAAEKTELPGFRKGKAPLNLVEEQLDKNYLQREILNHLISHYYPQLISEHKLQPVTQPRVTLNTWKPYTECGYTVQVAERPLVSVGDYYQELKNRAKDILGKNSQEEILEAVLAVTEAEISELLIENEAERLLSRLLDQITKLGLTIENYLQTKNQTLDQLREEYRLGAKKTLTAELAFAELIKKENIKVSNQEIEEALAANPDQESRRELEKEENRWYIESVLARGKLLDKLYKYVEAQAKSEETDHEQRD